MGYNLSMSDLSIEQMLKLSENKFLTLFQLSPVGMAIVDNETGDFLDVNNSVLKSAGYTKEEFLKLSYWDITPKEYEPQELQQIKDLKETGSFGPNEKEYIRKDGVRYPIRISGVALINTDGKKIVLGIIEDISQRKEYEDKLKYLALYDPLTQLPNRHLLFEKFHQAIAQNNRVKNKLAVLMLDLDKFKQVNDTLGHLIGDELLKESAKRIQSVISRNSDIVARFGGDEFIILLSPISKKEDVSFIAQKICNELARPFYIEKNTIEISSSIGIAIYPEHGSNKTELVSNADKALYNVKNRHKNGFEFFDLGNKIV